MNFSGFNPNYVDNEVENMNVNIPYPSMAQMEPAKSVAISYDELPFQNKDNKKKQYQSVITEQNEEIIIFESDPNENVVLLDNQLRAKDPVGFAGAELVKSIEFQKSHAFSLYGTINNSTGETGDSEPTSQQMGQMGGQTGRTQMQSPMHSAAMQSQQSVGSAGVLRTPVINDINDDNGKFALINLDQGAKSRESTQLNSSPRQQRPKKKQLKPLTHADLQQLCSEMVNLNEERKFDFDPPSAGPVVYLF